MHFDNFSKITLNTKKNNFRENSEKLIDTKIEKSVSKTQVLDRNNLDKNVALKIINEKNRFNAERRGQTLSQEIQSEVDLESQEEEYVIIDEEINRLLGFNSTNRNIFQTNEENAYIKNFIEGSLENNTENKTLDFLYSVESNKRFVLDKTSLDSVLSFKENIVKNKFEIIENKFNMLCDVKNFDLKIHEILKEKKDNSIEVVDSVFQGIKEKTDFLKNNSFESILRKEIYSNKGKYFNNIINYVYKNIGLFRNSQINKNNEKIIDSNLESSFEKQNLINLKEKKLLKDNLIFMQEEFPFEFIKPLKSTSNDIVMQSIINSARSLATLSTNCFIGNYYKGDDQDLDRKFINYDSESLLNLTSEVVNFEIFSYFTSDIESINPISITFDRKLKKSKIQNPSEDLLLNESFNSLLHFNIEGFYSEINIIDPISFSSLTTTKFLNDEDDDGSFLSEICFKINKIFDLSENSNGIYGLDVNTNDVNVISKLNNIAKINQQNSNFQELFLERFGSKTLFNFSNSRSFEFIDLQPKIVYFNKKPLIKLEEKTPLENNVFLNKNNAIIDNVSLNNGFFNELIYKTKLDSLVKKSKINNLKNNNVNLENFNQVVQNINTESRFSSSNKVVSYCKNNNDDKISALDSKNKFFDLLFTDDEDVYSHIDLTTNHSVNNTKFKGLDSLNKDEKEVNQNRDIEAKKVKDLISLYYPKNALFCSTTLFSKILEDVSIERFFSSTLPNTNKYATCQALYFNIFKNNNSNTNSKKIISRRFLKKALFMSYNSDSTLKDKDLEDYVYDIENIKQEDYGFFEQDLDNYLNDILNSSGNLKTISNSVFSERNIVNLLQQNSFECISNVNILNKSDISYIESQDEKLVVQGLLARNIFLENFITYLFHSLGNFNENITKIITLSKKNKIIDSLLSSDLFPVEDTEISGVFENRSNGLNPFIPASNSEDEEETYYTTPTTFLQEYLSGENSEGQITKSLDTTGLDITKTKNIKTEVTIQFNDFLEDRLLKNSNSLSFILEDKFDEITNTNNTFFVFKRILSLIVEIIKVNTKDFNKVSFREEADIDKFISDNEFLVSKVTSLIELYAPIYLNYYFRLNRHLSLKNFEKIDNESSLVQELSEIQNINGKLENFNNPVSIDQSFATSRIIDDIDKLKELLMYKEDNIDSMSNLLDSTNILSPDFCKINVGFSQRITNIAQSLLKSDLQQALNFDIINGCINYQNDISNMDLEEFFNNQKINNLKKHVDENLVNEIDRNFYNLFYINSLSKNMFKEIYVDEKIQNFISAGVEEQNLNNFYKNNNIFNEYRDALIDSIKDENFSVNGNKDTMTSLSESDIDYYNSNFYTFGLRNKNLDKLKYDSLIKITVNILDKFNLNHVYLPRVYLFSPLLTDPGRIKNIDFDFVSNSNALGFYKLNENLDNRFGIVNYESIINDEESFFKNLIKNKFNLPDGNTADINVLNFYYRHLIMCHVNSKKNKNFMYLVHDINDIERKRNIPEINTKIEDFMTSLSDKEFFNVFDENKEDFENKDIVSNSRLLHNKLNNISNINNLFNVDYYDTYNISVNPKDFYYVDISSSGVNIPEGENLINYLNVAMLSNNNHLLLGSNLNKNSDNSENLILTFKTEII